MKLLLQKSAINHYQEKKSKDFRPKKIYKNLVQSRRKKFLGRFENKSDDVETTNIN